MGKTPVKTRKSRESLTKSSLTLTTEGAMVRCPKGHQLPHRTDKGRCSPLECCEDGLDRARPDKMEGAPEEAKLAKVVSDEELRVKIQASRKDVWQKFLGIPSDLRGAEAEKYADDELVNMLPFAVGVLKKQLFFGTEEQQERAASKVLDANGKGKKEAAASLAPTMIIQMAPGTKFELPWAASPTTVDGQVVASKPEGNDEKK